MEPAEPAIARTRPRPDPVRSDVQFSAQELNRLSSLASSGLVHCWKAIEARSRELLADFSRIPGAEFPRRSLRGSKRKKGMA